MANQEQDRSEEATPHKREEARRKGTVAKSLDVQCAALVGVAWWVMLIAGPAAMGRCLDIFTAMLANAAAVPFSPAEFVEWFAAFAVALLKVFLSFFLSLAVAAVLVGAAQAGLVWSSEPLKPDWNRLNPISGLKRLFSLQLLFEAAKTLAKFSVFICVLYFALRDIFFDGLLLLQSETSGVVDRIAAGALRIVRDLWGAMLLIALIDWVFVRRALAKKLRMSKRELREEHKRREGDARIKAKLRELRMQFMQKIKSTSRVKNADVLVVNPLHLALAIQFKRGYMAAPLLLSKGSGELAMKMRQIAYRHGVPIFEDKRLARDLYRDVDVNGWIPEAHYASVAKALVWAFRIRAEQKQ